ncbi:MAG: AAA family ATPase [Bacillota bacterium]|nr:AAA family ATPase [Bacillota bacterium]
MRPDSLVVLSKIVADGIPAGESLDSLSKRTTEALEAVFGQRYAARSRHSTRVVMVPTSEVVSFAGLVHEESAPSGVYGGMSLVWFPVSGENDAQPGSLLTFVCGTRGLAPDEHILGRPGHARHLHALRRHLQRELSVQMWVKQDPTNLSQSLPRVVSERLTRYEQPLGRYGNYIYAAVEVPENPDHARLVVGAFLDLYAWERNWVPLKAAEEDVYTLRNNLRAEIFPKVNKQSVSHLLKERRFVILQGPPGTGKTRLADEVLRDDFAGNGMTVQFHPAITYESFVSGISPDVSDANLRFGIRPGWFLQAIKEASSKDSPYLLLVDEINRADLARVLGEAIYLFEAREIGAGRGRSVRLPFTPDGWDKTLAVPDNLYVLGTMNSADRSIAIMDLAVRRRFAFVDIWPDLSVVENQLDGLATEAFGRLQDIFAQFAPPDTLVLMPGHAYFLAETKNELANRLTYDLMPLIREYLLEGRLGPCESELLAYLDWLEGELAVVD